MYSRNHLETSASSERTGRKNYIFSYLEQFQKTAVLENWLNFPTSKTRSKQQDLVRCMEWSMERNVENLKIHILKPSFRGRIYKIYIFWCFWFIPVDLKADNINKLCCSSNKAKQTYTEWNENICISQIHIHVANFVAGNNQVKHL